MQPLQKPHPDVYSDAGTQTAQPSEAGNVLPIKREAARSPEVHRVVQGPVAVGSIYIVGDGTAENPLKINLPALAAAIINSMTSANFMAIRNGIASCDGAGATGSIGAGGGGD